MDCNSDGQSGAERQLQKICGLYSNVIRKK